MNYNGLHHINIMTQARAVLVYCSGHLFTYTQMDHDLNGRLNPASIFLAEDDEDDIFLMREALSGTGIPFVLSVASNGQDLIRDITGILPCLPDYIFLDINMPVKNGYETLQVLRGLLPVEIPIFMLSTACDKASVQQSFQLGATGHITKFIHFYKFTDVLRSIIVNETADGYEKDFLIQPDRKGPF